MILSTDENVVEWITKQIKQMSSTVEVYTVPEEIPQIKNLRCEFRKLNYKQRSIGIWLVKQLCQNGWEPFGDISFDSAFGFQSITLRKSREVS